MADFSHIDDQGRACMVDVGHKPEQRRIARASGMIHLQPETVRLIRENALKKGDVITTAEIAGIQAAKRTVDLIPLCHTLMLTKVDVRATVQDDGVSVECEVRCNGQTGVEMEALTGVSVALLTIYDMCKAVDKTMILDQITLLEKTKQDIEE